MFEVFLEYVLLEVCRYFICGFLDIMNGKYLLRFDDFMGFCEMFFDVFFFLKGVGLSLGFAYVRYVVYFSLL